MKFVQFVANKIMSHLFRQLPPTAVPIGLTELRAGLSNNPANVTAFRAALADYLGTTDAFLAASGRTAFFLLLQGLKVENPVRSDIVLPAYTCPSLVKVILDVGLKPVFVDMDPQTFGYLMDELVTAVSPQTLAIIVVHPFGIPQPVEPVMPLARKQGAIVIEDAAQSLGAKNNGHHVGLVGDYALYSLGPGKPISTAGGGIVVSSKIENQAKLARWWTDLPQPNQTASTQAWLRQTAFQMAFQPTGWWAATKLGLHKIGDNESSWGYRVRGLTAAQAGIGLTLLPQLDAINQQRRENATCILAGLTDNGRMQKVIVETTAVPIYLRLPLLANSFNERENLFKQLWNAGIGVGRMYEPAVVNHISWLHE